MIMIAALLICCSLLLILSLTPLCCSKNLTRKVRNVGIREILERKLKELESEFEAIGK